MSLLKRFGADRRGAAAVEFALIAPVLVGLYLGAVELSQALLAQRKANHVASAVGDLVARARQVSTSNLDDYFAIGSEIMAPFPSSTLGMRISSLTKPANGAPTVTWSRGSGSMTARTNGAAVTIPITLNTGETVILAESTYQYASIIHSFLPQAVTYNSTFYLRPRLTDAVICNGC